MQIKKLFQRRLEPEPWKGLASGLIGGLVASWSMTQLQNAWQKLSESRQSGNGKDRKLQTDEQAPATIQTAEAVSESVFDHELTKPEKEKAGPAVHYAFGTTMGGLYGVAAEFEPRVAMGNGIPFGAALFVGADEIAVPAFGLSKPPTKVPLSKHVYGLASHLFYGLVADTVRSMVRRRL